VRIIVHRTSVVEGQGARPGSRVSGRSPHRRERLGSRAAAQGPARREEALAAEEFLRGHQLQARPSAAGLIGGRNGLLDGKRCVKFEKILLESPPVGFARSPALASLGREAWARSDPKKHAYSFPRSAWECRLGRSASSSRTGRLTPRATQPGRRGLTDRHFFLAAEDGLSASLSQREREADRPITARERCRSVSDAERRGVHSHAERGNECFYSRFPMNGIIQPIVK